MNVDLSKPLTDVERAYLEERGQQATIARVDEVHGVETPAPGSGDGTGPVSHGTTVHDVRDDRIAQLERELALLKGESADDEDADDEVEPYEAWTVPDLDAELKDRQLSTDGKKQDKVDRLYLDDESRSLSAK